MGKFAVIDTETTWLDRVMSIGVVIVDDTNMNILDKKYYIVDPEYKQDGMFSDALFLNEVKVTKIAGRDDIISEIKNIFEKKMLKKYWHIMQFLISDIYGN